jgi:hypothetical protein
MVGTQALQLISRRPWTLGATAGLATIVLLGIPTGVIDNPWFGRKVPVRGFEVVVLAVLAVITGLFAATYARPTAADRRLRRTGIASGAFSWFAISCPLCNPLVVALLGTSGATGAFARVQPLLGVAAVALGGLALMLRLRAIRRGACRIDLD